MNAVRKIFGYQARIPMRDDVTKLAVMAKQNPVLHQKIVDQGIIF